MNSRYFWRFLGSGGVSGLLLASGGWVSPVLFGDCDIGACPLHPQRRVDGTHFLHKYLKQVLT